MRLAVIRVPLTLLAAALLGGHQVAAEDPPDKEKCYHTSLIPKNVTPMGFYCISVDYFCPEKAEAIWSDWEFVSGSTIVATGGDATIGVGQTYTSTSGWFYGGGAATTLGGIGDFIKGNLANGQKVLELLKIDPSFSITYAVSSSNAKSVQLSAKCPAGLTCGLVASSYRLKITGKKYNIHTGNSVGCEDLESDKTTGFAAYYPILVKGPEHNAAQVKFDACAIGKEKGKLQACPGQRTVDPEGGNLPGKAACMVDNHPGFCMAVKDCKDQKKTPLKGPKDKDGKYVCDKDGNNHQCCVEPEKKTPPRDDGGKKDKEPPKCTVNKRSGVCISTEKCKKQKNKESLFGQKGPDGKWTCPGGNNIQCCVDKEEANGGKVTKCSIGGQDGVCLPTAKCSKVSVPGEKKADGTWTCPGGNDIQCCVDKQPSGDGEDDGGKEKEPPKCSVGDQNGVCLPTAKCTKISVPGKKGPDGKWPCPGRNDIQCCVDKKPSADDDAGKVTECSVNGQSGVCLPKSKCSTVSLAGKKGLDGKWPCPGGDNVQCCIAIST